MATPKNDTFKRWEKMYNDLNARIDRQKEALTRVVAENVAMSAALTEIVASTRAKDSQAIARDCLHAINVKRAEQRGSEGPQNPKEGTE